MEDTDRTRLSAQETEMSQMVSSNTTTVLHDPNYLHSHLIPSSQQPKGVFNEEIMKDAQHFDTPTANDL